MAAGSFAIRLSYRDGEETLELTPRVLMGRNVIWFEMKGREKLRPFCLSRKDVQGILEHFDFLDGAKRNRRAAGNP